MHRGSTAQRGGAREVDESRAEALAWRRLLHATRRAGGVVDAAPRPEPARERGLSRSAAQALSLMERRLFDLYSPLCAGASRGSFVIAHLAQSADGRIAAEGGAPRQITGLQDVRHTHRLRALVDAVLVGASTIACDDPQLTTRLVEGPCPTRVVLDPRGRLPHSHRVFRDGQAPTLLVTSTSSTPASVGAPERLTVPADAHGRLELGQVLAGLAARGLRRILVEGGAITVAGFLCAGLLDRLHLTIAPTHLGVGPYGLSLVALEQAVAHGAADCRRFGLGDDVLFDYRFEHTLAPCTA